MPSAQWIEKVVGDMDAPGQPFVIRVHHDAGYVALPHTHPEDENITVLTVSWARGMGSRINLSDMDPMEQGALGFVPKKMAHFGANLPDCFKLTIGTRMRGDRGAGVVVGALCSPANQFTRYWAALDDLKPL